MPISANAATLINDSAAGFWSAPAGLGTPAVITYSFLDAATAEVPAADFSVFSDSLKTSARQALAAWANVAGLTFIEVPASVGGEFRFGLDATMDGDTVGYAYLPDVDINSTGSTANGDIYLKTSYVASGSTGPGSDPFETLLHEIGHALGFKHPFEGTPILATAFDTTNFTVMSYTSAGANKSVPQSLDVEAIQYLYGTTTDRTNANITYSFSSTSGVLTSTGSGNGDKLVGIATADLLDGGAGNDTMYAEEGNDTMYGGAGFDWLDGGNGNDLVLGGDGNDSSRGLNGNDLIYGEAGDDDVNGNQGNDTVYGGDGVDLVRGGQGNDLVYGDAGDDVHVNGNVGNDTVFGGTGNDSVFGGQNQDILYGEDGNDSLSGDLGNDTLYGGAGNDTLGGGNGSADLYGGTGADRFIFQTSATDDVKDFSFAEGDRIVIAAGTSYTIGQVSGGNAAIVVNGTAFMVLTGITPSSVTSDWIVSS